MSEQSGNSRPARRILLTGTAAVTDPLRQILTSAGHAVEIALPSAIVLGDYDLAVVQAPAAQTELHQQLRGYLADSHPPLVVFSVSPDSNDAIALFDAGADDLMTGTFGPEELLARVRQAWRRNTAQSPSPSPSPVAPSSWMSYTGEFASMDAPSL